MTCVASTLGIFSSQISLAGGSLIDVDDPKTRWTGFYIGGGLGIQKLGAEIDVKSKNHSEAADYKCKNLYENYKKEKINGKVKIKGNEAATKYYQECLSNYYRRTLRLPRLGHHIADFNFDKSWDVDGEWEFFGSAMVGYDYRYNKNIVLGAFANIDFGEAALSFDHSFTGPTTDDSKKFEGNTEIDFGDVSANVSGNLNIDNIMTVGARMGYLLNERTLAYLLAGYSRAKLNGVINVSIDGDSSGYADEFLPVNMSKKISEDINGFTLGAGGERQLSDNWSIRLEYRFTWFDSVKERLSAFEVSDDSIIRNSNKIWARHSSSETDIDISPYLHSIRFALTYKF